MTPIDEVVLVGSQNFATMIGYRLSKGVFFDAGKTEKVSATDDP
jgi:hypothetical protein